MARFMVVWDAPDRAAVTGSPAAASTRRAIAGGRVRGEHVHDRPQVRGRPSPSRRTALSSPSGRTATAATAPAPASSASASTPPAHRLGERVPGEHATPPVTRALHQRVPGSARLRGRWNAAGPGRERLRQLRASGFDSPAHRAGSDFVVNTYTTGIQTDAAGRPRRARQFRRDLATARPASFERALPSASTPRAPAAAASSASTPTPRDQLRPRSPPIRRGNFIVAWTARTGVYDVFARRFGGLGPGRARGRQTGRRGNRVLEPGETVDVRTELAELQRRGPDLRGSAGGDHRPSGRDVLDHRRDRRLRQRRQRGEGACPATATATR